MKIIFFGTPDYVVPVLAKLHDVYNRNQNERDLIAVVTQPPREVGRKKIVSRSSVDNWAYRHKIEVFYDTENLPQADLGVLAAYGQILPKSVIKHFSLGILNIHPSLLPLLRGASPIQGALSNGLYVTGVSVMKMDELMDHGPIISQFKEEIKESDTSETLRKRLFDRSTQFLIDLIPNYASQKVKLKEQDHGKATFTRLIAKQDGFVPEKILKAALKAEKSTVAWNPNFLQGESISSDASGIYNLYRALTPWPGIWTNFSETKRLKILKCHLEENKLILDEVQLEGKNPVSWEQFVNAYKPDFL